MSALEALKKAGNNLVAALNWVGTNFTALLVGAVAILGFLYSRKRDEAASLQTDIELKDKTIKVETATKDVEDAKQKAENSTSAYDDAKREYDASRPKDM